MKTQNSFTKIIEDILVPSISEFNIANNLKGEYFKFIDQELLDPKFSEATIWNSPRGIISAFCLRSDQKLKDLDAKGLNKTLNMYQCFCFIDYLLNNEFVHKSVDGLILYFSINRRKDGIIRLSTFNKEFSLFLINGLQFDENFLICKNSAILTFNEI